MRSRGPQVIDTSPYDDLVSEAIRAFAADPSYAVRMSFQARTIINKREVWNIRVGLRQAERIARSQCEQAGPFECHAVSPCGIGDCKYAEGDLALLQIESPGRTARPQSAAGPAYSIEAKPVVNAFREMRAASGD